MIEQYVGRCIVCRVVGIGAVGVVGVLGKRVRERWSTSIEVLLV